MIRLAIFIVSIVVAVSSGCSMKRVIVLDHENKQPPVSTIHLIDKKTPKIAGSFYTTTGNIYSCHYGIRLIVNDEIVPERLVYLEASLNQINTGTTFERDISVKCFTIVLNQHTTMKSGAMASTGITSAIAQPAIISAIGVAGATIDNSRLFGCDEPYSGSYRDTELQSGNIALVLYFEGASEKAPIAIRMVKPMTDLREYKIALQSLINQLAREFHKRLS